MHRLLALAACLVMTTVGCSNEPDNWALPFKNPSSGSNCVPLRDGFATIAVSQMMNSSDATIGVSRVYLEEGPLTITSWRVLDLDSPLTGVHSGAAVFDGTPTSIRPGEEVVVAYVLQAPEDSIDDPEQVIVDYHDSQGREGRAYLRDGASVVPEGKSCDGDGRFEPKNN